MSKIVDPVLAWETLGEVGREDLRAHLVWVATNDNAPYRYLSEVMVETDVSAMTCTSHPLERVAAAHGCNDNGCCTVVRPLQLRQAMQVALSRGDHAVSLVRAFLGSPHLAFPPDIPNYALRCAKWVKQEVAATAKRAQKKMRELEKAGQIAARKKVAETWKQLRALARKQYKASYVYRIEQAEKALRNSAADMYLAERRVVRLKKKQARLLRSVLALKRAAAKKGEVTT